MNKRNLTYSQLVDECINDTDRLYARLGGLRDAAVGTEKDAFNFGRGVLTDLYDRLTTLQTLLRINGRFDMKLGDWCGSARAEGTD